MFGGAACSREVQELRLCIALRYKMQQMYITASYRSMRVLV